MSIGFIKKTTGRDVPVDDTDNPLPVNLAGSGGSAISATNPIPVTGAVAPLVTSLDWKYAAASGGITDTSDVAIKAAPGAALYNVIQSIQITNNDATVGTEVVIKDGSTIIWRMYFAPYLAAVSQPQPVNITFSPPLSASANAAFNVACITTSSQTYVNAQGTVVG